MKIFKLAVLGLISGVSISSWADDLDSKLNNPLLHQGLVNRSNFHILNKLSQNYPKQNTINVGWLGVFRRYNSGETLQNRTALETKRSETQLLIDMDGSNILDWSKVKLDKNNEGNFSTSQYTLSLETSNIRNPDSPIVLILLSNQHVINDYLSNPTSQQLAKAGYTMAVLENPNYGVSLGRASLGNWLKATSGAVQFLSGLTGRKVFVLGHSIGGPLAIQAAAEPSTLGLIAGVLSYGGFTDLYAMGKDNVSSPFLKLVAKPIVFGTVKLAGNNLIDGIGHLKDLAKNQIPALIMHGAFDGAVPPAHLKSYQNEIVKLEKKGFDTKKIETILFADLFHEEVNNYNSNKPEDFNQVWLEIGKFIENTKTRSSDSIK